MTVIGLCGRAGAGKDEVGKILVERHGFVRLAFSDAVKDAALALDPFMVNDTFKPYRLSALVAEFGWDDVKRRYPEARRTLQRLGTEVGRDLLGVDTWVDVVRAKRAAFMARGHRDFVVTDVRFENERAWIARIAGVTWRVLRPDAEHVLDEELKKHASETGLRAGLETPVVLNDKTLDDLAAAVASALGR